MPYYNGKATNNAIGTIQAGIAAGTTTIILNI